MNKIYRHIDVCINRIQEGLRVIDEIARFHLEDKKLFESIKTVRHNMKNATNINNEILIYNRDSINDMGFNFQSNSENSRKSLKSIVFSSTKRVIESLRILEEFSKLPEIETNVNFEKLRQAMYQIEKELILKLSKLDLSKSKIYPITPSTDILNYCKSIDKVSEFIQLRVKNLNKSEIIELIDKIKSETSLKIIINDHIDICISENLAGVHLGQEDMPMLKARQILGHDKIIGISTHNVEQAIKAKKEGADYIGIGPIYETQTKDTGYTPLGLETLKTIVEKVDIPTFAIGGISKDNFNDTLKTGVTGCAVISVLQDNPECNYNELYKKGR